MYSDLILIENSARHLLTYLFLSIISLPKYIIFSTILGLNIISTSSYFDKHKMFIYAKAFAEQNPDINFHFPKVSL